MATFTQLVAKVKDWSNRGEISDSKVLDFLDISMKRVNNILRIVPMEHVRKVQLQGNELLIPSDMIEVIMIRTVDSDGNTENVYNKKNGVRSFSEKTSMGQIDSLDYTYSRITNKYILSPAVGTPASGETAAVNATVEIYYYRVLPDLNATYPVGTCSVATTPAVGPESACTETWTETTTAEAPHWFRDEQDEVLLYGALSEVFNYLGEEADAQRWDQKFEMKLEALRAEEAMREWKGGTVVMNINTGGLI